MNLSNSNAQTGSRDKNDILVFDTESLDHIDFNALISQSREERENEVCNLAKRHQDYLDDAWDQQIESDLALGKLDRLIAQAEADIETHNVRDFEDAT
jgi:hypothetical protein